MFTLNQKLGHKVLLQLVILHPLEHLEITLNQPLPLVDLIILVLPLLLYFIPEIRYHVRPFKILNIFKLMIIHEF